MTAHQEPVRDPTARLLVATALSLNLIIAAPMLVHIFQNVQRSFDRAAAEKEWEQSRERRLAWERNPTNPINTYNGQNVFEERVDRFGNYHLGMKCPVQSVPYCWVQVPEGEVGNVYKPVPKIF